MEGAALGLDAAVSWSWDGRPVVGIKILVEDIQGREFLSHVN